VSEYGRRLSPADKNEPVTVALLASNVAVVEQYAEVLPAGPLARPGEPAASAMAGPMARAAAGPAAPPGSLADAIAAAILREVPEYAQPGDDDVARTVRRVAHEAVAGLSARVGDMAALAAVGPVPAADGEAAAAMFRDLGRLLAMEGRSLGALQAALRVGARVTWQRLHEQARQGQGDSAAFARIGETVFWYMDELAAASSAGYAEARAELAGETGQLRRRLLDLLTASSAPPAAAIASLAQAAGWPLPRRVAAVALTPVAARTPGLLPPDVLADLTRRDPCLLIPDPDGPGRRRQLAAALHAWLATSGRAAAGQPPPGPPPPGPLVAAGPAVPLAAVGPAVPLSAASASLRWAGQALALARRGLVRAAGDTPGAAPGTTPGAAAGPAGLVWCEDHLPTLVLLADADLAATLSQEALAPLRPLSPAQADRLARTLLAWLESAGDANAAARRLQVHPQTIRYRLRQVTELFGAALTDPDDRFRLLLALRVRRLLGG
jgi:PucR-like helix-turn-helix protein